MSPAVAHAKSYPFAIPQRSYVVHANGYTELFPSEAIPDLHGLTPILACGSNQSPDQLARKFDNLDRCPIPVLKCRIKDFDAVHSPHFSNYGSIPATLHHHPGVQCELAVTWLHDEQLGRMHETEVGAENYHYARLDGIELEMTGVGKLDCVHAYISSRGSLNHDGKPLALESVPASGREWPEVSQDEVQALARNRLSPRRDLDLFIAENVEDHSTRRERILKLAEDALPFTWPKISVVAI